MICMKNKLLVVIVFFLLSIFPSIEQLKNMRLGFVQTAHAAERAKDTKPSGQKMPEKVNPSETKGLKQALGVNPSETEPSKSEIDKKGLGGLLGVSQFPENKKPLEPAIPKLKFDDINRQIILAWSGHYEGKIDGKPGRRTKKAVTEFQRGNSIPDSGKFDLKTKSAIEAAGNAILKSFGEIGFKAHSPKAALDRYARFYGIERATTTSQLNKLKEYQEKDHKLYDDVCSVYYGSSVSDKILSFKRMSDKTYALVKGNDGVLEHWEVRPMADARASLRVGLTAYLPLRPLIKEPIITTERKRGKDLPALSWSKKLSDDVKNNSDESFSFFRKEVHGPNDNNIGFQIGKDHVTISGTEWNNFHAGKGGLPGIEKFLKGKSKLVLLIDPLIKPAEEQGLLHVVQELNKSGEKIVVGRSMELARQNVDRLPSIEGAKDLAVYMPEDEHHVTDYKVIDHIEDALHEAKIKIIKNTRKVDAANIVVITGHNDAALRNYVEELGPSLRDKYVLMLTCHDSEATVFYSKIIKRYDVKGFRFISETIQPDAVKETVYWMSQIIREQPAYNKALSELLTEGVKRARENNSGQYLLIEIEKMTKGITQVSFLRGTCQQNTLESQGA